jgi:hypothetical protein
LDDGRPADFPARSMLISRKAGDDRERQGLRERYIRPIDLVAVLDFPFIDCSFTHNHSLHTYNLFDRDNLFPKPLPTQPLNPQLNNAALSHRHRLGLDDHGLCRLCSRRCRQHRQACHFPHPCFEGIGHVQGAEGLSMWSCLSSLALLGLACRLYSRHRSSRLVSLSMDSARLTVEVSSVPVKTR